jgi:hypothetical protein
MQDAFVDPDGRLDGTMNLIARKVVFAASIIRMAAAVVVAGAIAYGIYLLACNAFLTGLTWIVGAAFCGFVGNVLFGLVHMLGSAAAGPASPVVSARRR